MLFLAAEAAAARPLLDALVILATAGVAAILMRRLRLEVAPAYLIAGALIGPMAFGLVSSGEGVQVVSSAAIILLMFGIGLHLDLSTLAGGVGGMILAGIATTIGTAAIGWPVAMLFGLKAPAALAVSLAFAMSSTAVVLRLLTERRALRRPFGRLSFLILIVQDLLVVLALVAIPALARWQGAGGGEMLIEGQPGESVASGLGRFLIDAALKLGGVGAIIILGRLVLPRLLHEAALAPTREVMLVLSTAAALGAALATQAVGFSPELGAFLAGLMLSATPFRHQLAGQIGPLRDLFVAVFFTTVGMHVDPAVLWSSWWIILLATAALVLIKSTIIGTVCWAAGAAPTIALTAGLLLAQAGEFSLVLLGVSHDQRAINDGALAIATAVVALSLIITPSLAGLADRLRPLALRLPPSPWVRGAALANLVEAAPRHEEPPEGALRLRHVILSGFGVVGRAVADKLDSMGVRYTIIDINPATIQRQRALGRSIVYGDVSNPEVLESAGARHADAVILTIPDEDAALRACQTIRSLNPRAFIAARTNFLSKGLLAARLGADHVTVEEIATAEAMAFEVTKQLTERAISGSSAPTTHINRLGSPPSEPV